MGLYYLVSFVKPAFTQIFPIRVRFFDQRDLLLPKPSFDLFLTSDGCVHISGLLKMDQTCHVVSAGEARKQMVFVLIDPSLKLIGDTGVEYA